jgi:hypothetical protein
MPDFPPQPLQGCFSRHGIADLFWFVCTEKRDFSGFLGKMLDFNGIFLVLFMALENILYRSHKACEASGAVVFLCGF